MKSVKSVKKKASLRTALSAVKKPPLFGIIVVHDSPSISRTIGVAVLHVVLASYIVIPQKIDASLAMPRNICLPGLCLCAARLLLDYLFIALFLFVSLWYFSWLDISASLAMPGILLIVSLSVGFLFVLPCEH